MIAADTGSETSHLVSRPVTSYAVQATPQELALDPPPTVHSESAKAVLFGAIDGLLCSFAVIAGGEGGGLGYQVIIIMGFSNVIANGISMGIGDFLSGKARNSFIQQERRKAEWEAKNDRDSLVSTLIDSYYAKGMNEGDARAAAELMAKKDNVLVDAVLGELFGAGADLDLDECASLLEGVIMLVSFGVAGSVPLLAYSALPSWVEGMTEESMFAWAAGLTAACLFAAGALKSLYNARGWFLSGLEVLVLGMLCAGTAHEVGAMVSGFELDL